MVRVAGQEAFTLIAKEGKYAHVTGLPSGEMRLDYGCLQATIGTKLEMQTRKY